MFTQGDRTLDRSRGGLGIGLTLVRSLVALHDGSIVAHSGGTGHGSEFILRLPIPPAYPTPPENESVQSAAKSARKIVVVDDNHASAHILARLLCKLGDHLVTTAYDGPSALQAILDHEPDVVFLDIGLPLMDGYEVAQQVRARGLRRTLLVALTGYGQESDRLRSEEAGFDVHLVKPPDIRLIEPLLSHPKLES